MKFCNNNNDVPKKTDDQQLLQLFVIVLKARLNALPFLELAGNIERLKDVFATCALSCISPGRCAVNSHHMSCNGT